MGHSFFEVTHLLGFLLKFKVFPMRYLSERDLLSIGIDWNKTVNAIESAVRCLDKNDFSQPIKPYLRYRNLKNRIIAMPAFLGGYFNMAGIKWIASFPENINKGIARAHSVVILNDADTGKPVSVINTALLSILRTVSVSGLVMRYYDRSRKLKRFNLGIIGWGPIGKKHLELFFDLYGERIDTVFLYDIRPIIDESEIDARYRHKVVVANNWEEAYCNADVFITCTVSSDRYINQCPKPGSLQLNVSLRDYKPDIFDYVKDGIIVDDWDEVCRENTDIECMHKEKGLQKNDAKTLSDVVCRSAIDSFKANQAVMFNPMGMGVFDIAIAVYYLHRAEDDSVGTVLEG
jgi:ornithine cyclodeaminase